MSTEHGLTCNCGRTFATVTGLQAHLDEHAPETLYAIINPAVPEGEGILDTCETLNDVPFLELRFADGRCCEMCNRRGGYYVADNPYGVAECRFHVEQGEAVLAVVESTEEVKQFEMPEASVQSGEQ